MTTAEKLARALERLRSIEFGHSDEDICRVREEADEALAAWRSQQAVATKASPEFLAALDHFSTTRYDWNAPHLFVSISEDGTRRAWDVTEVCRLAQSQLDPDEMPSIKLAALREGLRKFGLHGAYEQIMGEKLC